MELSNRDVDLTSVRERGKDGWSDGQSLRLQQLKSSPQEACISRVQAHLQRPYCARRSVGGGLWEVWLLAKAQHLGPLVN